MKLAVIFIAYIYIYNLNMSQSKFDNNLVNNCDFYSNGIFCNLFDFIILKNIVHIMIFSMALWHIVVYMRNV
jgi:hypothetical protein